MAPRDVLERYQMQLPCVNRLHRSGSLRSKAPTFTTRSNGVLFLNFGIGLRWRRYPPARRMYMTGKTDPIGIANPEGLCVAAGARRR